MVNTRQTFLLRFDIQGRVGIHKRSCLAGIAIRKQHQFDATKIKYVAVNSELRYFLSLRAPPYAIASTDT